jgi:hypothetical protein
LIELEGMSETRMVEVNDLDEAAALFIPAVKEKPQAKPAKKASKGRKQGTADSPGFSG